MKYKLENYSLEVKLLRYQVRSISLSREILFRIDTGRNISQLVFENESNPQLDAVFPDLPFTIQLDLLVLDPR